MAVKTITITKKAYEILKARKQGKESFSEAIIRVTGRRKLNDFYGILTEDAASGLEKTIMEMRGKRKASHDKRAKRISEGLGGQDDMP